MLYCLNLATTISVQSKTSENIRGLVTLGPGGKGFRDGYELTLSTGSGVLLTS